MTSLRWEVSSRIGAVSGILMAPHEAHTLLLLGHGAGADMHHRFMEGIAAALQTRHIATLRYQFPYTEAKKRRPDPPAVLRESVRAALRQARDVLPKLPLFAGGKSMGGRITADVCSEMNPLPVRGLVFLGFPLHAPGKPALQRAAALRQLSVPMLFLQGDKDKLADLQLLRPLCKDMAPHATLRVLDDADHSFNVPKRRGLSEAAVLGYLADEVLHFVRPDTPAPVLPTPHR